MDLGIENYSTSTICESVTAFNDIELLNFVNDMENELSHLSLENLIMEDFIKRGEPTLITDMDKTIETALKFKYQDTDSKRSGESLAEGSEDSEGEKVTSKSIESTVKMAQLFSDKGPRINITMKTDMVMRVIEEMKSGLDAFNKRSKRLKSNLKAKSECIGTTLEEVIDAAAQFKEEVVTQGTDPITGKIAGERFIRYMEDWLKSAEFLIGKMRLRKGTLKALAVKLNQQRLVKEELSEKVDPIDYDQLHIENENLKLKLEQKKNHLVELKTINGRANLVLSKYKLFLLGQTSELNDIKEKINEQNKHILYLDNLECEAEGEAHDALQKLEHIQKLTKTYKVPNVMEYIRLKSDLAEIRKQIQLNKRRNGILEWKLTTATNKMRALTGSKMQNSSWYKNKSEHDYEKYKKENIDFEKLLDEGDSTINITMSKDLDIGLKLNFNED